MESSNYIDVSCPQEISHDCGVEVTDLRCTGEKQNNSLLYCTIDGPLYSYIIMQRVYYRYISLKYLNQTRTALFDFYANLPGHADLVKPLKKLNRKITEQSNFGRLEEFLMIRPRVDTYNLHTEDPLFQAPLYRDPIYLYHALVLAIMNGNVRLMKKYLDSGVRPYGNEAIRYGAPLLIAVTTSAVATRILLEYGALENCERYFTHFPSYFILLASFEVVDAVIELAEEQITHLDEFKSMKEHIFNRNFREPLDTRLLTLFEKYKYVKKLLTQPTSLFTLARRVVVRSLGFLPERRSKVQKLPVPELVKRNLCLDYLELKFAPYHQNVAVTMVQSTVVYENNRRVVWSTVDI